MVFSGWSLQYLQILCFRWCLISVIHIQYIVSLLKYLLSCLFFPPPTINAVGSWLHSLFLPSCTSRTNTWLFPLLFLAWLIVFLDVRSFWQGQYSYHYGDWDLLSKHAVLIAVNMGSHSLLPPRCGVFDIAFPASNRLIHQNKVANIFLNDGLILCQVY